MKMFRKILLTEFLPFLFLGVALFTIILVLADVFTNLWKYLNQDVPFSQAIIVSLLYGPKALIFALPIGAMFAAAFSLGNLGARNELIAVFGAGVRLFHFIVPILVVAFLLSIGGFLFEDRLAIPFIKERNLLAQELLGLQSPRNRSQVLAISRGGEIVYYADHYNDETKLLTGVLIIQRDLQGNFIRRIDAARAIWIVADNLWSLESARIFYETTDGEITQEIHPSYRDRILDEDPEIFRLDTRNLEEMNSGEAFSWIQIQKNAGLPYKKHLAILYQRYTIALTPFLVVLFAGALGGRFRRNILLMSLLASLGLSAGWYISRMLATLLSELGHISPLAGAVIPYLFFLSFGIWLFKLART